MSVAITIDNVVKRFGKDTIINGLSVDVRPGEFFTLLGPSGCGKTTLLRMIIGFNSIEGGTIKIDDQIINDIPTHLRNMGMVFQNYAVFPHMSVKDNVAFGLKNRKVAKEKMNALVDEILETVKIAHLKDRMPTQLSGGQQQRVALARAIVIHPQVLLMDEPLSNLDAKLRVEMRNAIKLIQQKIGITTVYVTHDQEEALTMSDRIAIINQGVLEQVDTAFDIYEHPKTRFVAGFIGESNIFDAVVISQDGDTVTVGTEVGKAQASGFTGELAAGTAVSVSVRPENMLYSRERVEGFHIKGVVKEHIYVGNLIKTIVLLNDGTEVKINRFSMDDLPKEGEMIYLYWHLEKGIVLPEKNLVDTDASRDIEGGDEDEEE